MKTLRFLAAVALLAAAFIIGRISRCRPPLTPPAVKVDTLTFRDTVTVLQPVYLTRWKTDSVRVPAVDTVRVHDTLWVVLERERVTWEDSLARVYASGVQVSVDSVQHFREKLVITKEIPVRVKDPSRWGLGVQAGATVTPDGVRPYVGVGVSYNVLRW